MRTQSRFDVWEIAEKCPREQNFNIFADWGGRAGRLSLLFGENDEKRVDKMLKS